MFLFWIIQVIFFSWTVTLVIWPVGQTHSMKQFNLAFSYLVLLGTLILGYWVISTSIMDTPFSLDFKLIDIESFSLNYSISVDTLAYLFMLLTAILIPLCMLSSWNNIKFRLKEFLVTVVLVEWILFNMFMSSDLLIFYIWFESVLLPMYFLIGVWGSRQRKTYASFMFFFYTFLGSLFMLFALFLLYTQYSSLYLMGLFGYSYSMERASLIWLLLMLAFAVKVPMFPAHIWLPEAHVEAPTVGSVILAGVLLKLGIFAVLRFLIPLFPNETQYYAPLVSVFALLGILYISLTTIRQTDLKKIIAYASVAHMNYVVLGVFGTNILSMSGSIFLMIGHGVVSAGLFFLIGFLYDRYKTRNIRYYRGLVAFMPIYALTFLIFTLANMSFPGTCNFIGESIILFGLTQTNLLISWLAAVGIIFCAIYSIWLFNRIMYGPLTPCVLSFADLSKKEFWVLLPLLGATFILGIFPNVLLSPLQGISYLLISYYI